jgi:hypothetical protein
MTVQMIAGWRNYFTQLVLYSIEDTYPGVELGAWVMGKGDRGTRFPDKKWQCTVTKLWARR